MKALHSAENIKLAEIDVRPTGYGRRFISLLLCLSMVVSMICGTGVMTALSVEPGPTENIVLGSRVADPNTMDDYLNRLLTAADGSRYAGRVWTDKTVFAFNAAAGAENTILLDMKTDGYVGSVGFNADFAHVFSALASSQVVNEYPPTPIDLVIVFDMSGSMGQDTRYGIDTGLNIYVEHNKNGDSEGQPWPDVGVPMAERIKNSRIQQTLDAINQTIDKLMAQNPQNRVAVCGYGANAVVLMPLGHYKKADDNTPYLTVGGMETLYHPSDLVYRETDDHVTKNGAELPKVDNAGWYWMNNRDTCYTVVVNAQYNTYTGILDADGDNENDTWRDIKKTVSNNVLDSEGKPVKAFPGVADQNNEGANETNRENSQKIYNESSTTDNGTYAAGTDALTNAMNPTQALKADDYVGYFTNTQGGIYLAYKQLADSTATTYTETLTNGVVSTVARIPAAIIMSDGGANFAFNEMGNGSNSDQYRVKDWNLRYGQKTEDSVKDFTSNKDNWRDTYYEEGAEKAGTLYMTDDMWSSAADGVYTQDGNTLWDSKDKTVVQEGRPVDNQHRFDGQNGQSHVGDEWYKVFLPGNDTLGHDETAEENTNGYWKGLEGLHNAGADYFHDGTLSTQPAWNHAGVLYNSDNDLAGTSSAVLEVLLTAAYMNDVVQTHYSNGWTKNDATLESQSKLFTYTMNVDTEHVPQWGRWRLFPSLDPKEYSPDSVDSWSKNKQFGEVYESEDMGSMGGLYHDTVFNNLKEAWNQWKGGENGTAGVVPGIRIKISPIAAGGTVYNAGGGDDITVTNEDVVDNIAYNDEFFDVTSEDINKTFDRILALILGNVFVPVSGDNDAGVSNSITYQDPLGEYMEIKNQAITAQTHKDKEAKKDAGTYDMSLLVFGEMHGLVRAGVYDWNWNDQYMSSHPGIGAQGTTAFPMGWYYGNDPKEAKSAENYEITVADDGSGTYPTKNPDGTENKNTEDAWKAGWVYRFNFSTLLSFVPITGVDTSNSNVHPNNLPAQVKNTIYTCYRFAGTAAERNELHRNPIYGDVPPEVQTKWEAHGSNYPVGNEDYAGTPGVYRLSDIRVWVEDTGDFVDTTGAITPNSGYDRSLYVNIPAAAIPTELATITLGRDGVLSYETNLGGDHLEGTYITVEDENGEKTKTEVTQEMYENFCAQSTPFRLFYAVGLEENLILRDENGKQTGVDFTKISPEYIQSHTVEGQDYVWFISNYYSGTRYGEYATEDTSHTRGDPTVTFSPGSDNRYYVFQKPLPLYAHAYRVQADGTLKPVDRSDNEMWTEKDNRAGNGKTTWENSAEGVTGGGSWIGGRYMGTYASKEKFESAAKKLKPGTGQYIIDSSGVKYEYVEDGIVFLQEDLLDHVTSKPDKDGGGYTENSVSFSSDDYYFILLEFYVPYPDTVGKDDKNNEVPGTQAGHMVQYALARKGSEFGSGFASDNIDNGDMLCWTDTKNALNVEFAYLSKTDTGDLTRGEPTWEKLTYKKDDSDSTKNLKNYLQNKCGIDPEKTMPNPDYDPSVEGSQATIKVLDYQVEYWTNMQENPFVQEAMNGINNETAFKEKFKFSVAARPGGIRSGDMSNNLQYKGNTYDAATQLYNENVTKTSNTYYLPTVSDNSGTDDSVIINNYLGNNGRLEIANQMLHVTKMLEAPEGFTLTDAQKNETFNYQIYVQGVTGKRSAIKTQYNEFSGTWDRQLAYIDVLTDNSDLVVDNDSNRALFLPTTVEGTLSGGVQTAKQVIENEGKYYLANEDGTLTIENGEVKNEIAKVKDEGGSEREADLNDLYYLYLPPHGSGENAQHTRRLYQNPDYTDSAYQDTDFKNNGTTTFYSPGQWKDTGTTPGAENRDSYRETNDYTKRPAGTITYWAQDAELIPVTEVQTAETVVGDSAGGSATYALETVSGGQWVHAPHRDVEGEEVGKNHIALKFFTLVIRKPSGETSMTAFESPFKTRSAYMTVELEFGKNANSNDGSKTEDITESDVYDQIIPTADRPDLFNTDNKNTELAQIAANTAEFTLKHGEGLLLSGLDNRIAYRFTEKLTDKQLKAGYTLKQISHIQQRGSESIYRPGVQNIPIYSKDGATYGAEYGSDASSYQTENGLTWKQADLTPTNEPFAHTNAIMWEYYATMAANSSGNHHQPNSGTVQDEVENSVTVWNGSEYITVGNTHTVADNPNCNTASSKDELTEGMCDLQQDDGSILHYMYYQGQFIDPHYEGEASTYLRNMARYGVSPTVHFGVNGEGEENMTDALTSVPSKILEKQASGDKEYYDYNGVYSVYGNTGWFEEQANFVNTIEPDMLVVTKEVVDKDGKPVEPTSDMVFTYVLKLTDTDPKAEADDVKPALTGYDMIYIWRGNKNYMTSTLTWEDGSHETPYNMPKIAPNLDKYQNYIPTGELDPTKEYLQPMPLTNDGVCIFTLKADEAAVFYGIPAGTNYTVTEMQNPNYLISQTHNDPYSDVASYVQTGEVLHYRETSLDKSKTVNRVAMRPSQTDNRENYYNQISTGKLTVEKQIRDEDKWTVDKTFSFTVTLTAGEGKTLNPANLTVTKYTTKAEGGSETSEPLPVTWKETIDENTKGITELTTTIDLKHGERFVIGGIPFDTKYTVQESGRDGYNLEYVVDVIKTPETTDSENFIHPTDFSTEGKITEDQTQAYWLFVNAKPPFLPFTGGNGSGMFFAIGAISLIAFGIVLMSVNMRRRRRARVK